LPRRAAATRTHAVQNPAYRLARYFQRLTDSFGLPNHVA
jgi:hypothetical protein